MTRVADYIDDRDTAVFLNGAKASGVKSPVLVRKQFEWHPTLNDTRHIDTGWYDNEAEVHQATVDLALAKGWQPRKWWQFWRWSENVPMPLRALEGRK